MFNIMINNLIVIIINNVKLNYFIIMVFDLIFVSIDLFLKFCVIIFVVIDVVCCYSILISIKIDVMKIIVSVIWLIGFEGKGLIFFFEFLEFFFLC